MTDWGMQEGTYNEYVKNHLTPENRTGTMIVCVPEDIRGKYAGEEILLMLTFM